ncbi:M56 family metallopeptidase [Mucilaginibacter myungsuensis]|uniref:M56 family metallopeptidase n=1 Tax=Mucilaginibacter myungsuensis TaxID=649104 RepID=A0A929PX59_9SPHI|nr:M56 family metallopeptidase [Mucilaginibacter myungsuensis]MBE9662826.1 M56 family metallopeptidase [Mucilaginibacter myungsuensis]MDN3598246.1 M56 family metallopeptidase [Mucilaginibacter myungsuensis]
MMYLVNFVLCSSLLLGIYKLFLQNERMYRFNRFYLLFSLVFSAVVPFVVIAIEAETFPVIYEQMNEVLAPAATVSPDKVVKQSVVEVSPVDYSGFVLPGLYTLITVALLVRFGINLYKIASSAKRGEVVADHDPKLILTDEQVTPHSFLRYIFLNKKDHTEGKIAPQIICHEQTHVRQLHTLDVLLVEVMQVICWFNPFIPFYRKAIQLNHEFLADEGVIQNYEDTPSYQYLLLAHATQTHSLQLTSQFNYQTTKKRLIMMTKTTSKVVALGKKLMLIPVAAMAVTLFSEKTQAEVLPEVVAAVEKKVADIVAKPNIDTPKKVIAFAMPNGMRIEHAKTDAPQSVVDEYAAYLKKYDLPGENGTSGVISAEDKKKMRALFVQMSVKQQDDQLVRFRKAMRPMAKNKVTDAQLAKWQSKDYGVWIDDKRVKNNADLANYKAEDFDHMFFSNLTPLARKNDGFKYQVGLMTKKGYADYYKKTMADQGDKIDVWHVRGKQVHIMSGK